MYYIIKNAPNESGRGSTLVADVVDAEFFQARMFHGFLQDFLGRKLGITVVETVPVVVPGVGFFRVFRGVRVSVVRIEFSGEAVFHIDSEMVVVEKLLDLAGTLKINFNANLVSHYLTP